MPSFQTSITPSRREAGRFINRVRRSVQKTLAEENKKRGLTQSDIARTIGVHRSVINREINGYKDITLGRVAELAFAMGRIPSLEFLEPVAQHGSNIGPAQNAGADVATGEIRLNDQPITIAPAKAA